MVRVIEETEVLIDVGTEVEGPPEGTGRGRKSRKMLDFDKVAKDEALKASATVKTEGANKTGGGKRGSPEMIDYSADADDEGNYLVSNISPRHFYFNTYVKHVNQVFQAIPLQQH